MKGDAPRRAVLAIPDIPFGDTCGTFDEGCRRCGAELTGRRKKWCSTVCRTWWYWNHRWTNARREAMHRAKHKCMGPNCDQPATEVDHIIPRKGMPLSTHSCLHHQLNLRPLCHMCHVTRRMWDVHDV